jgi:polysaccharide pyruvyl transferase WcaK-like protein
VLLAKSARVRCMFLNVGAGPISHRFSKLFIRHALGLADYVSFRDAQSQALARQIGFNGASQVFPDCVYSFEVPTRKRPAKQSRPIVGIAPMPYCDPRVYPGEKNKRVYDEFIRKLAMFVSELTEQRYSITPFGTDIGVDGLAIEDLQRVVHNNYGIVIPDGPAVASIHELLDTISGMDYIVTCRFHGVVFAHLLNKPVLAVSHHPKVTRLMTDIGLSKYCIDIDQIEPKVLVDLFASLVDNAENIKDIMNASAGKYKRQVTAQFNELFPNCRTVFSTRKPEQSCAPSRPTSSTSVLGL